MHSGGYPEVIARPRDKERWFTSYVQTYLERDVRSITAVHDLPTFRRFMGLLATRHGSLINMSDLAAPLGLSVPTIGRWIDVLEATGVIARALPYYENLGKRLMKSAKLYWTDSGLVCHLLGIRTRDELERSPFLGAVFEGFVAAELIKSQIHRGRRQELYFFRDQQGLEVDFIVPSRGGGVALIEAKATRTPTPAMAKPLLSLAKSWREKVGKGRGCRMLLVQRGTRAGAPGSVAPGVRTTSVEELATEIDA